ncbi:acetoacetate--CoA ligase [Aestuariirhabdus litorea]|uniref:Acetoacetate--CoA ligase n=1 Tax=Aestuariirhabdus litorea TaxID=2528527 RepID=A0A3P3VPL2_9GAMM|nr:acetoacetate--CoA ligase [Aestuariirhabdus litorea]RRJ84711.1 acetoacetate--CoA ligase [Aestuariirhabdus litorea]RWW97936.1 acetoacetate--CoA ligase [Endozoicomonadaceae bacterium GTF-13]
MDTPLWSPSAEQVAKANITDFRAALNDNRFGTTPGLKLEDYWQLHQWSVENAPQFWDTLVRYDGIQFTTPAQEAVRDADQLPGAQWFPGARLNFAQNLLRRRDDHCALVFRGENGARKSLSYGALYQQVARLAHSLKKRGVGKGDRVAGFMPNCLETVVAMLATTSLGAVWSSCSPDFGINGVIDRFGQIAPKLLFTTDGYHYNGKNLDNLEKVARIEEMIDSLEAVVVVPFLEPGAFAAQPLPLASGLLWESLLANDASEIPFEPMAFDDPLYIMYSSGTTGVPKCIVHGVGGTLLQHRKEHRLHTDLKADDVLFYYTTCGWMMWNWLVSGLASGATLVLFDGSPFYPEPGSLIDMAQEEKITVFGTSAKYIAALEKAGVRPAQTHSLPALRTILSTGSPLSHESFDYVYREIKTDLCLSSISGGTDIISCFALGCPALPVYRGQLQCTGLAMDVHFVDEQGHSHIGEKGELVCRNSFPSMPIGFWNDPEGARYHSAYFEAFKGWWCHGDYGERTEQGGVIIHGRADAVLNPGGVRIGTAEIYRQVEQIPEVQEAICVGQQWLDDVRVILFVRLQDGERLSDELVARIRQMIRSNTTPRHVPAKVIAVADIPRTISGKIVELAVRNVIHGEVVKNTDALANPEALELYRDLPELKD